jgi:DNA-binding MarR family transcriptional regulator
MSLLTEYKQRRNRILQAIWEKKGENFSIAEIRDDTLESREAIRDILYKLKNMSYLTRQRNADKYKFWERTSLMPTDLAKLITNYEDFAPLVPGRKGGDFSDA